MTPEEAWREQVLAALDAIAASLDVIAATLGATLAASPAPPCPHPDDERVDLGSTMGHPRWRCKACGYEVTT